MYQKIWVTGGSGLLGKGLESIVGDYADREFLFTSSKDCELCDQRAVIKFVETHKPDAIIHFAAKSGGIAYSTKYPATLLRDNVLMNLHVAEAARLCGVKKTVMSLSTGMYAADAPLPLREESIHDGVPHETNASYAFAKRLVEPTIDSYRSEYGMNIIGLIPNGMYGEYSNYNENESIMLAALVRRFYEAKDTCEPLIVWGDGSPLREYTYAPDMARAYMWCLDNYDEAQILHVGSTEEHSVKEIAFYIAEIMGIDTARIEFDTSKPTGIHRRNTDNSKFVDRSQFSYTPLREGLEQMIGWFSEHYTDSTKVRL